MTLIGIWEDILLIVALIGFCAFWLGLVIGGVKWVRDKTRAR